MIMCLFTLNCLTLLGFIYFKVVRVKVLTIVSLDFDHFERFSHQSLYNLADPLLQN